MTRIENMCVGCETCTLGHGCELLRVKIIECDTCGCEDDVMYRIGDQDYCESCANDFLNGIFAVEYSVTQKAELLDEHVERLN